MALREEFEASGNWLFRWRSYLPFLLFGLLIPALPLIHRPFGRADLQNAWEICCFVISLSGLAIRCLVGGHAPSKTSGRNTACQVAETLNTTGIYSIVRHPLYVGNYLMWLGIALFCFVPWVAVTFTLLFWLYYERIMFAEEEFLRRKFGSDFEEWSARTPAFFPRFSLWKPPSLPFCLRTVIRREFTGLFGIAVAFIAMDQFESLVSTRKYSLEPIWIGIGLFSLVFYLIARTIKKNTRLLRIPGR